MSGLKSEAKRFAETHREDDVSAYKANYNVGLPGILPNESTEKYHSWSPEYEQDLNPKRYRGPAIAAESVAAFYRTHRDKVLILDVACGTGFVGEELWKRGFRQMDGLDPCLSMLERARAKKVYTKEFCCYLNEKPLPIVDNVYDCAVMAGGMIEGHVPCSGLYQLARVVKPEQGCPISVSSAANLSFATESSAKLTALIKLTNNMKIATYKVGDTVKIKGGEEGGLVCLVMREEFLGHVEEYRDNLDTVITDMESRALWRLASKTVVPNFFIDKNGVVFNFVKC